MLSVFNHLAIDLIWKDGYLFIYLFVYLFNPFLQNLSVSDAVLKFERNVVHISFWWKAQAQNVSYQFTSFSSSLST